MYPVVLLIFGFLLLFLGGELLVRGSVALALRMNISTLVVGMTIVSFATSAPELFVSLQALFDGRTNIALGNIIGSNITNITLVLGITAIIFRVQISKQTVRLNYPILLLSSMVFGGVLYYFHGIPQIIGFIFMFCLILFTYLLIKKSRQDNLSDSVSKDKMFKQAIHDPIYKSIIFLLLAVCMLKYGADNLVDGAIIIAKNLKVSDRIIAITFVAIGTSIPELVTSIIAALKKEDSLAIGNLIGSNIFNILAVLGVTASVKEINIDDYAIFSFDYFWMISITLILGLLIYVFSKEKVSRKEGFLLVLIYLFYMYQNLVVVI